MDANDDANGVGIYSDDYPYYDTCGFGNTLQGDKTGWMVVLAYASILYLLFTVFSLIVVISYCFPIIAPLGICGHCLGPCAHFALIVVTGVYRYSDNSKKCADSELFVHKDPDVTFEDHGTKI